MQQFRCTRNRHCLWDRQTRMLYQCIHCRTYTRQRCSSRGRCKAGLPPPQGTIHTCPELVRSSGHIPRIRHRRTLCYMSNAQCREDRRCTCRGHYTFPHLGTAGHIPGHNSPGCTDHRPGRRNACCMRMCRCLSLHRSMCRGACTRSMRLRGILCGTWGRSTLHGTESMFVGLMRSGRRHTASTHWWRHCGTRRSTHSCYRYHALSKSHLTLRCSRDRLEDNPVVHTVRSSGRTTGHPRSRVSSLGGSDSHRACSDRVGCRVKADRRIVPDIESRTPHLRNQNYIRTVPCWLLSLCKCRARSTGRPHRGKARKVHHRDHCHRHMSSCRCTSHKTRSART
eukprot:PhM_4_TR14658/c0_g1_i1/m.90782